jgi:hypothetical protein
MNELNQPSVVARLLAIFRRAVFAGAVLCGLGALSASAQESILGIVTNAATGRALEGAHVTIQGTTKEAITDGLGVYSFPDVAPGSVTLAVAYAGLDTVIMPAVVGVGKINRHDVGLTSQIYKLGQFVVAGEQFLAARTRAADIDGGEHTFLGDAPVEVDAADRPRLRVLRRQSQGCGI